MDMKIVGVIWIEIYAIFMSIFMIGSIIADDLFDKIEMTILWIVFLIAIIYLIKEIFMDDKSYY